MHPRQRASWSASERRRVQAILLVGVYGPVPAASLSRVVGRLWYGVPQWESQLAPALARAKARLARTEAGGTLCTGRPTKR